MNTNINYTLNRMDSNMDVEQYACNPITGYMDHDNRIYLDGVKKFLKGRLPAGVKVIVGTNDQGWHGATLAKFAKENWNIQTHEFRGVLSDGVYGIPTRYHPVDTEPPFLKTRSLNAIKSDVEEFIKHAKESAKTSNDVFWVTRIGCGMAGYKASQIGPMFKECIEMKNVLLPREFIEACEQSPPSFSTKQSNCDMSKEYECKKCGKNYLHQLVAGSGYLYLCNECMKLEHKTIRIGIVGSSGIAFDSKEARQAIEKIFAKYENPIIVSGGAKGADKIGEFMAKEHGLQTEIYAPTVYAWDGKGGFKERNEKIAKVCDKVYSIAKKGGTFGEMCYHCSKKGLDSNHFKTGGCWTAHRCKEFEIVLI